jgi:hypothetical protein
MAPVAIDPSVLADENSQSKEMESLEPLTPKVDAGPPSKKAKKEKGTLFLFFGECCRDSQ